MNSILHKAVEVNGNYFKLLRKCKIDSPSLQNVQNNPNWRLSSTEKSKVTTTTTRWSSPRPSMRKAKNHPPYLSKCDVPVIFAIWWQIFSAFQKRPLRKLSVYTLGGQGFLPLGFYFGFNILIFIWQSKTADVLQNLVRKNHMQTYTLRIHLLFLKCS